MHLAPGLITALAAIEKRLGGALAIVSGRPVDALDRFLDPWRPTLAAEHGSLLRLADGTLFAPPPPDLLPAETAASTLAAAHPRLYVERKTAAIALHYRSAPELEELCRHSLSSVVALDPALELLEGKYVVEVKPAGTNKGRAISALMDRPPFAGRRPLFAGDDTTDEAGFASVQALGGQGIKVGGGETIAVHRCASPDVVRSWLAATLPAGHPAALALQ